jgi:ATP-dependent DNA helicase RecG
LGVVRPTISGILLFGTALGLRRHFPMVRVDYIRVPGRQWVEDPHHRFETIELRAPLIRLVGRAINAILDDLPKAFSLPENAIRREDLPLIPTRVLREAVVNAVMHRSYRIHSPVQIIRYSNRLEIRNPGYSLISEERWGDPGSVTRNPHLASVLHEINFAETKGSGIRVMRELMRQSNLTAPTLKSDRQKDLFVATFLFHHFLGSDDWEWLNSLNLQGLGDEEARGLLFVRETLTIDNAAYRDLNQVDVLNASTHLRRLRDQGLLEQRGKGSATYYIPTPRFLATLPGQKAEGEPMPGKKRYSYPP